MSKNKQPMLERLVNWITNIFTDTLSDGIKKLLLLLATSFLIWLAAFILKIDFLYSVKIPLYLVIIFSLFALFYVFVGTIKIVYAFFPKNIKENSEHLEKVQFEDVPREWRARVRKNDGRWEFIGETEVYCTIHNLRLQVRHFEIDEWSAYMASLCRDCEREGKKYKGDLPIGYAFHTESTITPDYTGLVHEVQSRILRQLELK